MSTADPFLPVPDANAEPDADRLPPDDRAELDRAEDGQATEKADGEPVDGARPALFKTPVPADSLDSDELRQDLELD